MSKMDNLRAMREARYEAAQKAAKKSGGAAKPTPPVAVTRKAASESSAPAAEGLCGHRSMNGRTCTREHGHTAKSHRYS